MQGGRSVETTMAFSTLDGLVMATRPGSLDAGAVLYLLQSRGMTAATVEDMLYHHSGSLGVSGISGDMRELAASAKPAAREAIELFVYRLCGEIGRLTSALGGLDGWCSPLALASTMPACVRRCAAALHGSVSCPTPAPTLAAWAEPFG